MACSTDGPTGKPDRRDFLRRSLAAATASWFACAVPASTERAPASRVQVLLPRNRVPMSFVIDDSTCLVNMGHFCMPQFATAWPDRARYKKPWKTWPREIPDAFVREFGEWCGEHGVKGKYSVVPYPACVGWLDRELPGWSRKELLASLKLVRELMLPNWDIHPEMITHTRVIDLASGRPMAEISPATMENSYPQTKKSVDELAAYIAYALRILKNCELPCEGITTPGGFGNRVKSELSLAVQHAVTDVFGCDIPHYFKYAKTQGSTEPKIEHLQRGSPPSLTVNVIAGTDDWFGSWDGDRQPEGHRYANDDATSGRMVEMIQKRQPAIMLCHWPGMYTHGTKLGFRHFQKVVLALERRFRDETMWMKLSEIARYWAAKELTQVEGQESRVVLQAPFATADFTVRIPLRRRGPVRLRIGGKITPLRQVRQPKDLQAGTWFQEANAAVACFDLAQGETVLEWGGN